MLNLHLRLIKLIGVIVPRRLRSDWRREWEGELRYRELLLVEWDRLNWKTRFHLLRCSLGALWDALWLQSTRWEDEMIQDLRFGVRMLIRNPSLTIITVITLALGIGVNTSIFSLVNAIVFRPLPVDRPEQLVRVYTGSSHVSYPNYRDFSELRDIFSGLAAQQSIEINLRNGDDITKAFAQLVSSNFFTLLGVQAAKGRMFGSEVDGGPDQYSVAVVSQGFWKRRAGSDPNLVGKTLVLNGHRVTVIGIAPEGFRGTFAFALAPELWIPLAMQPQLLPGADRFNDRANQWVEMIGRLRPNVSMEQAQSAASTMGQRLAKDYPVMNRGLEHSEMTPLTGVGAYRGISFAPALFLFLGLLNVVVLLVLLIACGNIANLLLARARFRQKEIAIRLALGASRVRLLRQLLTESVLMALLGGAAGCLLAFLTINLFGTLTPSLPVPVELDLSLDIRVLAYTLLLSGATGIVFGVVPGLQATRPTLLPMLKGDSDLSTKSRRFSFKNVFVVGQVATSLVLLSCTGLFLRSLQRANAVDPGFDTEQVLTASTNLRSRGYTAERGRLFGRELLETVGRLPGVQAASLASIIPLSFNNIRYSVSIEENSSSPDLQVVNVNQIGPRYFETMAIPVLAGREFTQRDDTTALGVAMINETFARRYWQEIDPIGKQIRLPDRGNTLEVIGVVRDSKYRTLGEAPNPILYISWFQHYEPSMILHVRTNGDPNQWREAVKSSFLDLDGGLLVEIATMRENLRVAFLPARIAAWLLGVFGLLGLLLAAVGIYGVLSYSVGRRTHEIGIRLALGARASDVVRLVIKQGMTLALIGFAVGMVISLLLTKALSSLLVGVGATDPLALGGVSAILLGVALAACYLPARRASRVEPVVALRHQ